MLWILEYPRNFRQQDPVPVELYNRVDSVGWYVRRVRVRVTCRVRGPGSCRAVQPSRQCGLVRTAASRSLRWGLSAGPTTADNCTSACRPPTNTSAPPPAQSPALGDTWPTQQTAPSHAAAAAAAGTHTRTTAHQRNNSGNYTLAHFPEIKVWIITAN